MAQTLKLTFTAVAVDVVLLALWTMIDPSSPVPHVIVVGRGSAQVTQYKCGSENSIWVQLMLLYKFVIILLGLWLAFVTRYYSSILSIHHYVYCFK
jgi:7 transmembrane sweet-taste receptor of 3 GCPR